MQDMTEELRTCDQCGEDKPARTFGKHRYCSACQYQKKKAKAEKENNVMAFYENLGLAE